MTFNYPKENQTNIFIKEKHIDNRTYSMPFSSVKALAHDMEKRIFRIKKINNENGTGFLCKIYNATHQYSKNVLITCNHVLNEKNINYGSEIKLIFNNETIRYIKIQKSRNIYTNADNDITIIEINELDNFDENNMFEIDDIIFNDEKSNLKNAQIYILHYPGSKNEAQFSYDLIRDIEIDNKIIHHFCDTEEGSSGSPIILAETRKIIAVHIGYNKEEKINCGSLLNNSIEEFFKIIEIKKNKILITLNIETTDINKDIYFLNNTNYYTNDLITD